MFLDQLNPRFRNISPENAFYHDSKRGKIVEGISNEPDFAKHPQGLLKELIIDFLSHCLPTLPIGGCGRGTHP